MKGAPRSEKDVLKGKKGTKSWARFECLWDAPRMRNVSFGYQTDIGRVMGRL